MPRSCIPAALQLLEVRPATCHTRNTRYVLDWPPYMRLKHTCTHQSHRLPQSGGWPWGDRGCRAGSEGRSLWGSLWGLALPTCDLPHPRLCCSSSHSWRPLPAWEAPGAGGPAGTWQQSTCWILVSLCLCAVSLPYCIQYLHNSAYGSR